MTSPPPPAASTSHAASPSRLPLLPPRCPSVLHARDRRHCLPSRAPAPPVEEASIRKVEPGEEAEAQALLQEQEPAQPQGQDGHRVA
eukprot:701922-Hanusia_phi.AAC.1